MIIEFGGKRNKKEGMKENNIYIYIYIYKEISERKHDLIIETEKIKKQDKIRAKCLQPIRKLEKENDHRKSSVKLMLNKNMRAKQNYNKRLINVILLW